MLSIQRWCLYIVVVSVMSLSQVSDYHRVLHFQFSNWYKCWLLRHCKGQFKCLCCDRYEQREI